MTFFADPGQEVGRTKIRGSRCDRSGANGPIKPVDRPVARGMASHEIMGALAQPKVESGAHRDASKNSLGVVSSGPCFLAHGAAEHSDPAHLNFIREWRLMSTVRRMPMDLPGKKTLDNLINARDRERSENRIVGYLLEGRRSE